MSPFRTILFAADFSESSLQAFGVACSLASADETQMIVLHVIEPHYVAEQPIYLGQQTVQYSVVERDPGEYEFLQRRLRECYVPDHPLEVEYRMQEGTASEEILSTADELACDLIVVGTHGRTGLDRLLTGSVAEAVLRKARCPVLALRSPNHLTAMPTASAEATRTPGTTPGPGAPSRSVPPQEQEPARLSIRTILYRTDFSKPSEAALSVARSFADAQRARLIILHVAPIELPGGGPLVPMDPRLHQDALEDVRRRLDGSDLNDHVETRLRQGDAAREILSVAAELECDLIVMGIHGRSGLGRLLMGSVAEAVLRGARCPVMTVKAPQAATNVVTTAPHVPGDPQWSGFGP